MILRVLAPILVARAHWSLVEVASLVPLVGCSCGHVSHGGMIFMACIHACRRHAGSRYPDPMPCSGTHAMFAGCSDALSIPTPCHDREYEGRMLNVCKRACRGDSYALASLTSRMQLCMCTWHMSWVYGSLAEKSLKQHQGPATGVSWKPLQGTCHAEPISLGGGGLGEAHDTDLPQL